MGTVETVVIGGGAMGSSTAWALARAGRPVLLLERFERRHLRGASHGAFRNFNVMYAQPYFQDMLVESSRLWRELEDESGQSLLDLVGMVNHGPDPLTDAIRAALQRSGYRAEVLDAGEAAERWPGIRFDGPVLHSPDGGRVRAEDSVAAMQDRVVALGGEVRYEARVVAIRPDDDRVEIDVESGGVVETITARTAVVTVGAWSRKLLDGVVELPPLDIRQVQPAHFPAADVNWPSFRHITGDVRGYGDIYGLLEPGEGVKIGWHGGGFAVDPDNRTPEVDAGELDALRWYVEQWMPGLDASQPSMISCTYTITPSEDFVLDRVGPIVVGAGFSGQGFKFTPAVGTALAGLVTGERGVAEEFRLARHRARR
jgi:sarcosine oxidase